MLTKDLKLEIKKEESAKWKIKQLFSGKGLISDIKNHINLFDFLSVFMVVITAFNELLNEHFTIFWYILTSLVLLETLYLRVTMIDNKKEK